MKEPGFLLINQNQISILLSVTLLTWHNNYKRFWLSSDLLCKTTQVYYV